MREITQTRVHYGCERVFVVLRREGWRDNHKRVHRIYKEEGLSLRHCRPRRSRSARRRQPIKVATAPNALWGMDFVSDALFDGRRFRLLTVVDHYSPENTGPKRIRRRRRRSESLPADGPGIGGGSVG